MIYEFEKFRFETERCELFSDGVPVHAEPQVCRILELLITNCGNVVTRDQIQQEIWGDRIVMPSALDNRIRAVRSLVDDDGRTQRLIKTFPNAGYKFVGEITEIDHTEATIQAKPNPTKSEATPAASSSPVRSMLLPVSIILLVSLLAAFFLLFDREPSEETAAAPIEKSGNIIAIMPFKTGIGQDEKLGTTISYKIISSLANVDSLGVVSAQSSFALDKKVLSARETAGILNADYILDGLASYDTDSMHLTAELVSTREDKVVWSDTFRRAVVDTSRLDFETDVARKITIAVANYLGQPINTQAEYLVDSETFQIYEEGLSLLNSDNSNDIESAVSKFLEVIRREPTFVSAYMFYSEAVTRAILLSGWNRTNAIKDLTRYANEALRIAPDSPETQLIFGNISSLQTDSKAALEFYNKALEKNSNFALAYLNKAKMLRTAYRFTEAWPNFEKALTYDPLSSDLALRLAETQFSAGEVDEAIRTARKILLWDPNHLKTLIDLGRFEMSIGNYASAMQFLNRAREINRNDFSLQFNTLLLYNNLGLLDELSGLIENKGIRATIAALKGDAETAYRLIQDDPRGWISPYVQYLLGDSRDWYKKFSTVNIVDDLLARQTRMPIEQPLDIVYLLDTFTKQNDAQTPAIRDKIGELFGALTPNDLLILEEFSGVAGYYSIIEDYDKAFMFIEKANEKNMIFLNRLKVAPVFENLRQHPKFQSVLKEMTKNRDAVLESLN